MVDPAGKNQLELSELDSTVIDKNSNLNEVIIDDGTENTTIASRGVYSSDGYMYYYVELCKKAGTTNTFILNGRYEWWPVSKNVSGFGILLLPKSSCTAVLTRLHA